MIFRAVQTKSVTTLFVMFVTIVSGLYGYINIARESTPDISIPIMYVRLSLDGVSPQDAERLLIKPMEKELKTLSGVKEMTSSAYQGGGFVLMEFESGYDLDKAKEETREAINSAEPELPDDAKAPVLSEVKFSEEPVVLVNLYGAVPRKALQTIAKEVIDELEGYQSILRVDFFGELEEQVEILINPEIMSRYKLLVSDIVRNIGRFNSATPSGVYQSGSVRFPIEIPNTLETAQQVLNLPVVSDGKTTVRLGEIAQVRRSYRDPRTIARLNGRPTVSLAIIKRTGYNTIKTVELVRTVMREAQKQFPERVNYLVTSDSSESIADMVSTLEQNVILAVVLVAVVIVAFIGLRSGLLIIVSIPTTLLLSLALLFVIGFSLNNVVLFSLILSVGMLVDASIVVVEYAYREIENGTPVRLAYYRAARRMASPIISSTATTLAVFLPLLFWPDIVGDFMSYLPKTLLIVLSSSLLVALVFIPVLGAEIKTVIRTAFPVLFAATFGFAGFLLVDKFLDPSWAPAIGLGIGGLFGLRLGHRLIRRWTRNMPTPESLPSLNDETAHPDPIPDIMNTKGFTAAYARLVHWIISSIWRALAAIVGTITLMAGIVIIYAAAGHGVEFFPNIGSGRINVNIYARGNLSVQERYALVRKIETQLVDYARQTGYIESINSYSGILSNRQNRPDRVGNLDIQLVNWRSRPIQQEVVQDLLESIDPVPGVEFDIAQSREGPPQNKPIWVELSGYSLEELTTGIKSVRDRLIDMPELINIEVSLPPPGIKWTFSADNITITEFGLSPTDLGMIVRMFTDGARMTSYRPDDSDDEIDVVARIVDERRNLSELSSIMISSPRGNVPLSRFLSRDYEQRTDVIERRDSSRVQTFKADVVQGANETEVRQKVLQLVSELDLPSGVTLQMRGGDDSQKTAQEFLQVAFIVAIFLIFIVLMIQFNSFFLCQTILTAVLISFGGMLSGLLVFAEPFGIVMGGVGAISLAGIVVNNNIVLIDSYLFMRKRTDDFTIAIANSAFTRLRPILLTVSTTALGLLPSMFGVGVDLLKPSIDIGAPISALWASLSRVIVFGLLFATPVTLLFTPAILSIRERYLARSARIDRLEEQRLGAIPSASSPQQT